MTFKRRLLDYSIVALLLFVPAVLLHANLKDPTHLNAFDKAVLRVSSPLQSAVSWVIEGVGGWWNGYVWLVDVEDENDELRADNARLRQQLAEQSRRAEHAGLLEELAGLRREMPAETVGARVVASSVNPYFRVARIRIDRGDAEVAPGMAVLNAEGLVGRIHHAYGSYSDVLLVTDPQSSIDVLIPRTGGRGVLTGLGEDESYACKIEYLERGEEVRDDDVVVTSGLGNVFPPGLAIGKVARVTTKEYGLYQEVEVDPSVDFSDLGRVLVVLAPPPPPDPDARDNKTSPKAYSVRPYQ
jgi:rod shape-determining protein MreC